MNRKLLLNKPGRMLMAAVLGTALGSLPGISARAEAVPATVTDLSRYCTACWRNARLPADCWPDCTQEVMVRLLERVPTDSWEMALKGEGEERTEFLRAIDTVKKRVQRSKKWSAYPAEGVADKRGSAELSINDSLQELRQATRQVLSDRQQLIVWRTAEGYSVQEIAAQLRTDAARVSDEKYKAIRKLRTHFGVQPEPAAA